MDSYEAAGWIFLSVLAVGLLAYAVVSEYLSWRRSRRFWRVIHMRAGRAVRENTRMRRV